jgi:hypothetical protein
MNYSALTLSSHELPTMILDPIKLPSYDIFFPFCQSKGWSMEREFFFFFIFAPTLGGGISVILVI